MATESKPIVVDIEDKPLATGESSGLKDETEEVRTGFFYTYCGGNPITALITPALTLAAIVVVVLGIAGTVRLLLPYASECGW